MPLNGGPLFSVWCLNVYVTSLASVLYGGWVRAGPTCPGTKEAVAGRVCLVRWGMVADSEGENPRAIYTGGSQIIIAGEFLRRADGF